MTSNRKIEANRANARASTGPRTPRGRARSAKNSLRHALSVPVCSDQALSAEVEALACEIAGPAATAEMIQSARHVAEAQIDLRRVRSVRHHFMSDKLSEPYYESRAATRAKAALITSLLRPNAPDMPLEALEKYLTSTPQGPDKLALSLLQELKQLAAFDRYERRALSRRKFAIRAFEDAARHRNHQLIA